MVKFDYRRSCYEMHFYIFHIHCRYEYFTSSDLSKRYPKSLSQAATKDLVGCIDHEAGLLMADKGLLALWVRILKISILQYVFYFDYYSS